MFFWLAAPTAMDTVPSEMEPATNTDPLAGMTLDRLEREESRCIADGWIGEAQRVRAEINRRVGAVREAMEAVGGE